MALEPAVLGRHQAGGMAAQKPPVWFGGLAVLRSEDPRPSLVVTWTLFGVGLSSRLWPVVYQAERDRRQLGQVRGDVVGRGARVL